MGWISKADIINGALEDMASATGVDIDEIAWLITLSRAGGTVHIDDIAVLEETGKVLEADKAYRKMQIENCDVDRPADACPPSLEVDAEFVRCSSAPRAYTREVSR